MATSWAGKMRMAISMMMMAIAPIFWEWLA
jgi:hypothetical protein